MYDRTSRISHIRIDTQVFYETIFITTVGKYGISTQLLSNLHLHTREDLLNIQSLCTTITRIHAVGR